MVKKFYITTPIFYVNAKPHIGSAYTVIVADILARFHRLKGEDVYFLTGTDENSQKNIEALRLRSGNKNITKDEIQKYLNEMAAVWQRTWDGLGISNDDFIRTTEERHLKAVEKFYKKVFKNGDIYEGTYDGYYCEGCEAFLTKEDLAGGKCAIHQKEPKYLKEKNLFFRLSKYREKLLAHIKKHPDFIEPQSRRNEVASYVDKFMTDFSITRENAEFGIAVPEGTEIRNSKSCPDTSRDLRFAPKIRNLTPTSSPYFAAGETGGVRGGRVLYVWFDALINYISAIGYGTDEKKFKKWWPTNVHLVGKDIIKFHCAYWPAMLLSAGLPLPKKVFAHGFFTVAGQKMSKSLGNAMDPLIISKKYGIDALRYFLVHEIKFGEDGDFSINRFEEVYNSELANELGNLVNRVLAMAEKYFAGRVPTAGNPKSEIRNPKQPPLSPPISPGAKQGEFPPDLPASLCEARRAGADPSCCARLGLGAEEGVKIKNLINDYEKAMEELRLHEAVEIILSLVRNGNQMVDKEKPWELAKTDKEKLSQVIYCLLDSLRLLGWMLWPIMPDTAEKIWEQLGIVEEEKKKKWEKGSVFGGLKAGTKIKKGETLFPKIN